MSTLDDKTVQALAEHLERAEREAFEVEKITDGYPDLDFEDAYAIQWAIRALKEKRGHRVVGLKMGLTSWAKMEQMRVSQPIYAHLFDYFAVNEGQAIRTQDLIHPKVEAEIGVVLNRELRGPGCTIADVMAATECVLPCMEVIDSRYRDFRFDLVSVVADNASSARFVTGGVMRRLDGLDLKALGIVIEKNGEVVATGAGAAVLGHPLASVAMLADMLAERGKTIPAGTFVMTGGITAAITAEAGDCFVARYQGLGSISLRFA